MSDSFPYRDAAGDYWAAGWRGILPIPANSKKLVLRGWTGHEGRTPSYPDVFAWMEGVEGDGNIALRMPSNVVGIDVDDYGTKVGAATVDAFTARHGVLPSTWRSTARPVYRSGIYFFRVPTGLRWPGQLGPNVEIIQYAHRYAVVHPSINPDAKAQYVWIGPDGLSSQIPRPEDLPELPAAWVEALTANLTNEVQHKAAIERGGVAKWIQRYDFEGTCRQMRYVGVLAQREFAKGSRHDALNSVVLQSVRLASEGHREVHSTLLRIRQTFEDAAGDEARGSNRNEHTLDAEWGRSVEGAIALIMGEDKGSIHSAPQPCDCDDDGLDLVPKPFASPLVFDFDPSQVDVGPPVTPEQRRAGRLFIRDLVLTPDELDRLPPMVPLIDNTLEQGTIVMLAGDFGTYKSFTMLDWALCIATGYPWMGRESQKGKVVFIAAEGASGISKRVKAWRKSRTNELNDFLVVPRRINLGDSLAVADVAEFVRDEGVSFIAFDTLNRCAPGLEENSAKDMGRIIDSLSIIRDAAPGAVSAFAHHSGKDGSKERGSSAIVDGVDTFYFASGGHGEPMQLERRKRKDGDEHDEHTFRLRLVPGTDSGVLDPIGIADALPTRTLNETIIRVFINAFYPQGGASRANLKEALPDNISRQAFHKAVGSLVKTGRLKNTGTDKIPFYRLGVPGPGDRWTAAGEVLPSL